MPQSGGVRGKVPGRAAGVFSSDRIRPTALRPERQSAAGGTQPVNTDRSRLFVSPPPLSKYLASGPGCQSVFRGPHESRTTRWKLRRISRAGRLCWRSLLQHRVDRNCAHRRAGLVDCGERNREQAGVFDIVDADHLRIFPGTLTPQSVRNCLQQTRGGEIVRTDDAVRSQTAQHFLHAFLGHPARFGTRRVHGPACAPAIASRYPAIRASTVGADPGQPMKITRQHPRRMRCDVTAYPARRFVDSHKIVTAALGIRDEVPVQRTRAMPALSKIPAMVSLSASFPGVNSNGAKKTPATFLATS